MITTAQPFATPAPNPRAIAPSTATFSPEALYEGARWWAQRVRNFVALDTETHLIQPGLLCPPIVCGSVARLDAQGRPRGRLLTVDEIRAEAVQLLEDDTVVIVGANIAYDFAVLAVDFAKRGIDLLPLIYRAYAMRRVFEIQISQGLDAIAGGHLGRDPRTGGPLLSPETGKQTDRYSLDLCVRLTLGRYDAKKRDFWRLRYAILERLPFSEWPEEARQYPVDDVENTLDVAVAHVTGAPGDHDWGSRLVSLPGAREEYVLACTYCGTGREGAAEKCTRAPLRLYRNLADLADQAETAFDLHLGAAWGLRTDRERVIALKDRVDAAHAKSVEKFAREGLFDPECACGKLRSEHELFPPPCTAHTDCLQNFDSAVACAGTALIYLRRQCTGFRPTGEAKRDTPALRRRTAAAYGATGTCPACMGGGRVASQVTGKPVQCGTCAATGLDLQTAPGLPRTPTGSVSIDRDTLMESGDEVLADFADNEDEKIRNTYLPFLIRGLELPLSLRPNSLLASGRASYEELIQLFPRKGGARECVRARDGYMFLSVDYAAIELACLAQVCIWVAGYSRMADVINQTRDPGALHTALGGRMIGKGAEEMRALVAAGDRMAKDARQASKCFHPDTEILTTRGWVKMSALTMDDWVASAVPNKHIVRDGLVDRSCQHCGQHFRTLRCEIRRKGGRYCSKACANAHRYMPVAAEDKVFHKDPAEMRIEWVKPLRLTTRHASELLHLKNNSIDLCVTPDHRMLAFGGTNELLDVSAAEFGEQRGWFNAGMAGGTHAVDENLLRLAVATQADGTYFHLKVRLGFSKQRKIERMRLLLNPYQGHYEEKIYPNGEWQPTTWFTLDRELSAAVRALLDLDKTLPWWWLGLIPAQREIVIKETVHWDGHDDPKLQGHYYFSRLKKNLDVMQAITSITNRKSRQTTETLSIKVKNDSRGENVEKTTVPYDGPVYCLTVPSGCVLVRDGGVPVITKQCFNFGAPAGMGAAKIVLTNRKKNAGETRGPDGRVYAGTRFCILVGGDPTCGARKVTEWNRHQIPPTCLRCLEIAQFQMRPAFFAEWPEVEIYLQWVNRQINDPHFLGGRCFCPTTVRPEGFTRVRGDVEYSSLANQGFQALNADGTKAAVRAVARECYLRIDPATGKPYHSPLYGVRPIMMVHDEIFAEVPESIAHEAGWRMSEVMLREMARYVPDITGLQAEPALMRSWSKDAKLVKDAQGRMIPWVAKS